MFNACVQAYVRVWRLHYVHNFPANNYSKNKFLITAVSSANFKLHTYIIYAYAHLLHFSDLRFSKYLIIIMGFQLFQIQYCMSITKRILPKLFLLKALTRFLKGKILDHPDDHTDICALSSLTKCLSLTATHQFKTLKTSFDGELSSTSNRWIQMRKRRMSHYLHNPLQTIWRS